VRNLASFLTSFNFEPFTFENAANFLCIRMIALCPRQVWWSWVHASPRTVFQSGPTQNCTAKTC